MNKFDLAELAKMKDLFEKKENKNNILVWVLAIIGAIVAGCAIAYAIYRYVTPDYLEEFEDEFDDEFEDEDEEDIFEDEEN